MDRRNSFITQSRLLFDKRQETIFWGKETTAALISIVKKCINREQYHAKAGVSIITKLVTKMIFKVHVC